MAEILIEAQGLTKYYGDFLAIRDVSFQVRRGEIVGFLGPNGSGKTTTMRILTGYLPPSAGTARIAGYDVVAQSLSARRCLGYMPETVPLYTDMTVEAYLAFMGRLRGVEGERLRRRLDQVVDLCKLGDYRDTHIGKLSKGYRQRVGLAQAILHEPEVLILDEPTIGIDPIQVVETRQLIKDLGREHTILLSTHILAEASMVCGRVLIIHEGALVAEDTPESLARRLQAGERVEVQVKGPPAEVLTALRALPGVVEVVREGEGEVCTYRVDARRGADLREQIARTVVERGWGLRRLTPVAMSLEEVFLRLTAGEEAGPAGRPGTRT